MRFRDHARLYDYDYDALPPRQRGWAQNQAETRLRAERDGPGQNPRMPVVRRDGDQWEIGGLRKTTEQAHQHVQDFFRGWDPEVLGRLDVENQVKLRTLRELKDEWDEEGLEDFVASELSEEDELSDPVQDLIDARLGVRDEIAVREMFADALDWKKNLERPPPSATSGDDTSSSRMTGRPYGRQEYPDPEIAAMVERTAGQKADAELRALRSRFAAYVRVDGDCHVWTGPRRVHDGTGKVKALGRTYQASHLAMLLEGKPVPSGTVLQPSCGNRLCVRPDHMIRRERRTTPH